MTSYTRDAYPADDVTLLSRVRGGDTGAYGVVCQRHEQAAQRFARCLVAAADADDLLAATFGQILAATLAGDGPDGAFRPYLLTALRQASGAEPDLPGLQAGEVPQLAQAFASLPDPWLAVLWHTEIEQESLAEAGGPLGLYPGDVAALRHRAWSGLRHAWIQLQLMRDGARCDPAGIDAAALRDAVAPVYLGSAAAAYLSGQPAREAGEATVVMVAAGGLDTVPGQDAELAWAAVPARAAEPARESPSGQVRGRARRAARKTIFLTRPWFWAAATTAAGAAAVVALIAAGSGGSPLSGRHPGQPQAVPSPAAGRAGASGRAGVPGRAGGPGSTGAPARTGSPGAGGQQPQNAAGAAPGTTATPDSGRQQGSSAGGATVAATPAPSSAPSSKAPVNPVIGPSSSPTAVGPRDPLPVISGQAGS